MPTFLQDSWFTTTEPAGNPGVKGKRFENQNFEWQSNPGLVRYFVLGVTWEARNLELKRRLLTNALKDQDSQFCDGYWGSNDSYAGLDYSPESLKSLTLDASQAPLASPWMPNLLPPDIDNPTAVRADEDGNALVSIPSRAAANSEEVDIPDLVSTSENIKQRSLENQSLPSVGRSFLTEDQ